MTSSTEFASLNQSAKLVDLVAYDDHMCCLRKDFPMSKKITNTWHVHVIHAFAITIFGARVPLFPIVPTWSWTYTKIPTGTRVMYRRRQAGVWATQQGSVQRIYTYAYVGGKKVRTGVKGTHYRRGIKLNSRGKGKAVLKQCTHYANGSMSMYWYKNDPFWSLDRSWFERVDAPAKYTIINS